MSPSDDDDTSSFKTAPEELDEEDKSSPPDNTPSTESGPELPSRTKSVGFIEHPRDDSMSLPHDDGNDGHESFGLSFREEMRQRRKSRSSSLELRKSVPDIAVLLESTAISDDLESISSATTRKKITRSASKAQLRSWFKRVYLNPSFTLKRQMLNTFGSISAVVILLVMIASIVASKATGTTIKKSADQNVDLWVNEYLASTARYVSETISPKVVPNELLSLMTEILKDRFHGYPNEDDSQVPFFDTKTQSNVYPLMNEALGPDLDWDFSRDSEDGQVGNIDENNYLEHLGEKRYSWYASQYPRVSTSSGTYHMQGSCDPNATTGAVSYHPNCTSANNDIDTGGVIAPTQTSRQVYRKSADLIPFIKALYEQDEDLYDLGYYFTNSGAGSSMIFPHTTLDSSSSYLSVGCDWLRSMNPVRMDEKPILIDEEIRRCHSEGVEVPTREYNPLERGWFRDFALDAFRTNTFGPYINAWNSETQWLMGAGRPIYDPITGTLVACILIDYTMDGIDSLLADLTFNQIGTLHLVRNDEFGTIASSQDVDYSTATSALTVNNTVIGPGVTMEKYREIQSLFDFSRSDWTPEEAKERYASAVIKSEESSLIAYPVPSIPDEYDPYFRPDFFIICSVSRENNIFTIDELVQEEIDDQVTKLVVLILCLGLGGLVVIFLLIFAMATYLTRPLVYINETGEDILNTFAETAKSEKNVDTRSISTKCAPKTEVDTLVAAFGRMVANFSGGGTTRRQKIEDNEVLNSFDLQDHFRPLYESRSYVGFKFGYPVEKDGGTRHLGTNASSTLKRSASAVEDSSTNKAPIIRSPLFIYMTGLMIVPLVVTVVLLSALVLWRIAQEMPQLIDPLKEEYLDLRSGFQNLLSSTLSSFATRVMEKSLREIHLFARIASWVFFGGIGLKDSLTSFLFGANEECKVLPSGACTFGEVACDCSWNDFYQRSGLQPCSVHPNSRALQRLHVEGLREDIDATGDRFNTSFPNVALTPNTTEWYNGIGDMPGPVNGTSISRYRTTLDRVKTFSSLSSVIFPLYNYDQSIGKPLGIYIGFEQDGGFYGYTGCDVGFSAYAFWQSTEANGASALRPELCPLNKYGYDCRCRGWYDEGKNKALANEGFLHISPPYVFAGTTIVAQSVTSPLIDPQSDEHIGQVLIDIMPNAIIKALESHDYYSSELGTGLKPLLITPNGDVLNNDVVVAPGYWLDQDGQSIESIFTDPSFTSVVTDMRAGGSNSTTFIEDGQPVSITYSPVQIDNFRIVNSSDFSRGVSAENTLVFSLAFIDYEGASLAALDDVDDVIDSTVNISIGVISALVAVSTAVALYATVKVAVMLTNPMRQLVKIISDINASKFTSEDVAILSGDYEDSCREVDNVYKTMETLYKVIIFANIAFFSGDLSMAYKVLKDALRVFNKLDNKKAVAVASNNLGNTMLTIYRTIVAEADKNDPFSRPEMMFGLTRQQVIAKGAAYYAHSIKLGEQAYDEFYDEQGWSEECLVFMQLLSNRYFNRAIFFLTTSPSSDNPKEAESLGLRDLEICTDMDIEIVDQCLEMGFKINRVERFELMISRIRGLLSLADLGYKEDVIQLDERINDVYGYIKNALRSPEHDLFKDMAPAGRKQKLDTVLMKYLRWKGDLVSSAKVGVRMLMEDEYVFSDSEEEAVKHLLIYMESVESDSHDKLCPRDDDGLIKKDLKSAAKTLERNHTLRISRHQSSLTNERNRTTDISLFRSLSVDNDNRGLNNAAAASVDHQNKRRSSAARQSCIGDVVMEMF